MTDFVALPDKRIRQTSETVRGFDKRLGMAAPQIGVFKKVFVAKIRNKFKPFVNPQIVKYGREETALLEGCFSVKGIYGHVMRPSEIDVTAQDTYGKKVEMHLKGLPAKIFQHELDHLSGKLFIDLILDQNGKLFRVEKDKEGNETLVETTI
ncbi:peptide deformylase [Candidatus Curtissbacteria bacterium]|nr:peptide deformylase [Candidatus Curtissbacteria bacterium]